MFCSQGPFPLAVCYEYSTGSFSSFADTVRKDSLNPSFGNWSCNSFSTGIFSSFVSEKIFLLRCSDLVSAVIVFFFLFATCATNDSLNLRTSFLLHQLFSYLGRFVDTVYKEWKVSDRLFSQWSINLKFGIWIYSR